MGRPWFEHQGLSGPHKASFSDDGEGTDLQLWMGGVGHSFIACGIVSGLFGGPCKGGCHMYWAALGQCSGICMHT